MSRNIVLICTDQWRYDCLSLINPDGPRTPFLDRLAENGVLCEQAYSNSPTCVPARMSLLTGLNAANHGRVGYEDGVDFDVNTTLAGEFTKHGYQTECIGKMHVWPTRERAGFEHVQLHNGYLHRARKGRPDPRFVDDYQAWLYRQRDSESFPDEYENGVHCNAVCAHPWDRPEWQHPTNWVTDCGIDWLYRRDPRRPFFLFLSYHRPHAPYNPPAWAFDMYKDRPLPAETKGNWETEFIAAERQNYNPEANVADYPAEVRARARNGYYGNITHLDSQIERFIEALADFDQLENTTICFTADHGDMMGDHGMWRKGYPYEGSAHIPLFFTGAGVRSHSRLQMPVEIPDLMPTLLELAGFNPPQEVDGRSFAGELMTVKDSVREESSCTDSNPNRSPEQGSVSSLRRSDQLVELPDEANDAISPNRLIHGEHFIFGQSIQWVIGRGFKYIWWSGTGREQLFDLRADPNELNDLLIDTESTRDSSLCTYAQILKCMREYLVFKLSGRAEGFVVDGNLHPGANAGPLVPRLRKNERK